MNIWYLTKVKYTKEFTDGTIKRITEPYLIDAQSFTDAEARIYQEVGENVRGEFVVQSMSKIDVSDIFYNPDSDIWFRCRIKFVTDDADTGKEKTLQNTYFLTADTAAEANKRLIECLEGLLSSYEITLIQKTKIIEVFPYLPNDEEE